MATKKQPTRQLSSFDELDAAGIGAGYTPYGKSEPTQPVEAPVEPRGAMRAVADTAVQFGKGALTGVRMMSDVFGANNAVSGGLRTADDALAGLLSATAKQDQAQVAAIMQEAEGKGWMEQIGLGLKAAGVAPGALLAQAAGTAIPTLASAALTGGAGPMAAAARIAAPALMGGAQGVGATKGAIYDEVKQKLKAAGASEAEAEARAVDQQSYSGDSLGQIALGGGLGVLAGSTGMERTVAGLRGGVTKAAPGIMGRMGVGGATEAVPELFQGGQEKYATNSALNNEGFKVDPMSGVVANATMEGAAGFGMGAAFGIPRPAVTPQQAEADAIRAAELVPPSGPMSAAANAGTESKAAAVERAPTASITGADPAQMLQDQAARSNPFMDQIRPSQEAGINPAAGPMSAAGALSVDTGITQDIQANEANAADQAAYEQATSQQEAQAAEQDTVDKPITTGKLAQMSEEDKRAILFSNQAVVDGGIQYTGTQDGDVLNGMGAPFKTKMAALRRATMEGKDWSIAPVFDGFVARRKDAMPSENNTPTSSMGGNIATPAEPEKQPNQPLSAESIAPVATENVAKPETPDDIANREWAANYSKVTGDIKAASDKDIERADGYASNVISGYQKAAFAGDQSAKDMIGSIQAEQAGFAQELQSRKSPVTQPAQAPKAETGISVSGNPAQPITGEGAGGSQPTQVAATPISRADIPNEDKPDATPEQVDSEMEAQYQQSIKESIQVRLGLVKPTETDAKKTPFKTFLRQYGIAPVHTSDIAGKNRFKANNMLPATFRAGGLDLDSLVERAIERGFMTEGDRGDQGKLISMIQSEIAGDTQVSTEFADDDAAAQTERMQRMEIEGQADKLGLPYSADTSTDQLASTVNRVQRRMEKEVGVSFNGRGSLKSERVLANAREVAARIERKRAQYQREMAAFEQATIAEQDALLDLYTDEDGNPVIVRVSDMRATDAWFEENQQWDNGNETDTRANQDSGQAGPPVTGVSQESAGDGDQGRSEAQPGSTEAQAGQPEGLTAPTRADIEAQQDRAEQAAKAEAKARTDAENKAKADAELGEFTLTGSDRAADVGAASGQSSMFDIPAETEAQAEQPTGVSTDEQVATAKELLADAKQGDHINDDDRKAAEQALGVYSLNGMDDPTLTRVMYLLDVNKATREKINRMGSNKPRSINDLADILGPLSVDAKDQAANEKLFKTASDVAAYDDKVKDLFNAYTTEKSMLDGIASERGKYGIKWAEKNVGNRWTAQSRKIRDLKKRLIAAIKVAKQPPAVKSESTEIDHNGTRIYQAKIKLADGAEPAVRWAVESQDNKALKADGKRAIGGDSLHSTLAEAKKAADFEAVKYKQDQERKARLEAESKANQEEAQAKKDANKGKSLSEIKAEQFLEQEIRNSSDGVVTTRAEWVKRRLDEGNKTSTKMVDKIKPMSRTAYNRANNQEQAAHEKKIKDGGKVPEYSIGDFVVTKTEYDYAQALIAAKPAPQTEAAPAARIQSADELRAQADLMAALADLGDIFGKNTRMNMLPEQEAKILPVMVRLFDAAFRLGYHKFMDAAKFTLDKIRAAMGDAVADDITLEHLQGAYISMSSGKKGVDGIRAVSNIEAKTEVEAHTAQTDNERNGETDAPSTNASVERDSPVPSTEPTVGDSIQDDPTGATGRAGEAGGRATRGTGRGQQNGSGVSTGGATAGGERGDQRLPATGEQPELTSIVTGADFSEPGGDSGITGVPAEPITASQVDAVADQRTSGLKNTVERNKANKAPVVLSDLDSIKATLPQLLPGQQEDVKLAETRFAKEDGYGMLFTNGTGTGKTFSGLGIIKRHALQGKTNTLIVAPDSKIASDWMESGKLLGLDTTLLDDTKDAGKGIVITTYANLGANDKLAARQWDLVVADEAHSLMQAADGEATGYLQNLRAITYHPDGAGQRHSMLNRAKLDHAHELGLKIESLERMMADQGATNEQLATWDAQSEAAQKELGDLRKELDASQKAMRAEVDAKQGAGRTRLVALSATPFAYEKTIDWANGYLFNYNEGQTSDKNEFRGYNQGSNKDRYMMLHFGYSMRYNKMTRPDANVDSGLMQRQWNGNLKKSGALSGRMLDVVPDYDRRFILVDSAIGNRIDEALEWISEQRQAEKGQGPYQVLGDAINEQFKYQAKRYLLEAIKADAAIPIVKAHMAMGRKVVVFHDYKKGGGFNPFRINSSDSAIKSALGAFNDKFKDLVNHPFEDMPSPIDLFSREIPGVLLINGDEKKADLLKRYKSFQDDANGPQIMLVQSAKNKGWSGHDTTGKHQRVLINLGQPTAPTLAIQQEGRIYRTGQASDAVMRYMNTGTNWERWTFASTIATRASTAENLGMGEMARALKDSFIQSFEESDTYEPGHEGEGKGGKERDKAANDAVTEYDRAKTFYFGQQKKNSRTKAQEGADYFATPEPIGLKMVQWLDARGGESVMEPSAGHGAISRWLPDNTMRTAIEPSFALRSKLALVMEMKETGDRIIGGTFEDHHVSNKYDGIVMNPPFGTAGRTAVDHLAKAATHLRDGGRIVALLPDGPSANAKFDKWFYESSEKPTKPLLVHPTLGAIYRGDTITFDAWGAKQDMVVYAIDNPDGGADYARPKGANMSGALNLVAAKSVRPTGSRTEQIKPAEGLSLVATIKLPTITFERAGTAVATRIVVIEKNGANVMERQRDFSDITDIKELFDKLENLDFAARVKPVEVAPAEPVKAEKPASTPKPAKVTASAGDEVSIGGTKYEVEIYTTNAGKEKRGVWMASKAEAMKYSARTFTHSSNKGKWFVDEYWFPKDSEVIKPDAAFSRSAKPTRGLPTTQVTSIVDAIRARWGNAPEIIIAADMSDPLIPQKVRDQDQMQKSQGATGEPEGFVYRGKVYILASEMATPSDVMRVLFHESLGHLGLRGVFGDKLKPILQQLAALRRGDVAAKAKQYGLDMNTEAGRLEAAEEVLAEMAQTKPEIGFVKRAIALIRGWLRANVPGFSSMKLTDADIIANYILPARRFVEGKGGPNGGMKAPASGNIATQAGFSREIDALDIPEKQFNDTAKQAGGVDAYSKSRDSGTTTLTYRQWVQVRTPNFKKWWGYDWEANKTGVDAGVGSTQGAGSNSGSDAGVALETAAGLAISRRQPGEGRVLPVGGKADGDSQTNAIGNDQRGSGFIDERTGEPRIFFHGTKDSFTKFDSEHLNKKDHGWLGRGNYVSSDHWISEDYSRRSRGAGKPVVMELFVRPNNPKVFTLRTKTIMARQSVDTIRQLTKEWISQGHNGALLDYGDGNVEIAVFESNGLKSATDNTGAFGEDGDIRFSRTVGRNSWDAPESSQFDDLVYKLQDKQIDTKRVVDAIKAKAGALADEKNVYLQEELFHGRAAARTEDFVNKELGPLVNMMKMRGIDIPMLDEYLHARHAEEANKLIAERNKMPNAGQLDINGNVIESPLQDGGSGMTTQAARDYLAKLTPADRTKLEAVAAKVDAILGTTRQLYADYDLESQDKVDGWGAMFKHYVPLMREDKDGGMGIGQGFSIKGKEVKGRTGSTRKVVDILANIAMQRERAIVRGEKNRVATALVGLVKLNPNKEFWHVGPPPATKVYDPGSNSVVERQDPLYKSRDNVVVAKIKGKDGNVSEQAVTFSEDDPRAVRMAASLKNLDAAQLEGLLGVSAKITRYFAAINTQYNPIFGTVNLVRDVQGALFNLSSTPLKGKALAIAGHTMSALKGIYMDARAARDGKTPASKWAELWEEFQDEGGQTGFRDLFTNSADRAKAIERELNPTAWMDSPLGNVFTANGALKVPLAVAQKKATGMFDWLSDYNLAMENAVRLAAYKVAKEQGISNQQAASLGKNLTVNFNRKGQVGQQAGALYAFFNASMQGTARLGQTLFDMEPGKPKTIRMSATGKKIIYGGILLGAMQALMLAAAGFDDEEPPDFVRERSLIIPTGGKTYITIPMPLGLHVLPNMGRIPMEFAMGGFKDPVQTASKLIGLFANSFNPIGGGASLVQMLSPTAIDPLVAIAENKDWTGKPIAKESFNKATPGHLLAKDTATAPAKFLSEAINLMSGGTEYTAGVLSPTPDQIDYLFGQVTGGVGREASKLQQSGTAMVSGEDLPIHKVPLVGRFYGDADTQSAQSGKFYSAINKLNVHEAEIKGLRKDGKGAEAVKYIQENPESRLFVAANLAEREVQKLRAAKRALIAKDAPAQEVKAMETRINERMTRFNLTMQRLREKEAA